MDQDELTNRRVHAIARAHDCTIDDVHAALDRHPIELNRDAYLRRALALELMRLDQLEMAFEGKALVDRDVASATLLVKVAERRATLLGLNAPIGHAVQVIQHVPEHAQTTLDEIEAALDNVLGITSRERELKNKQLLYSDEKLSVDEQNELSELQAAREAKRLAKLSQDQGSEPSTKPH